MRFPSVGRLPLAVCAAALLAAAPLAAQAPSHLGYQGRLLKADGAPETGVVDVGFKLYDAESGGTPLWSEAQKLALSDGFYATFLGDVQAFPAGVFDGDRWLELTVNGEALLPRQKLGSVAFALTANDARNVTGGKVDASSITVGGKQIVDGNGQVRADAGASFALKQHQHDAADIASGVFSLDRIPDVFLKKDDQVDWAKLKGVPAGFADGVDDGLKTVQHDATLVGDGASTPLGVNTTALQARVTGVCASGFVLRSINQDGSVVCAPDADSGGTVTAVTAAGPLVSSGGKTPQLSLTTQCAANQILKWNGVTWGCANDEDTLPTAGAGLAISNRAISLGACPSGQLWKSLGGGNWACADDADTTYLAGSGLALNGRTLSLTTTCAPGEMLKWSGTAWVCAPDDNAGGTVTSVAATGPLSSTGGRTPTISIAQAGSSASGYLDSNDWKTFNGKVSSVGVTAPLATTGGSSPTLSLSGCASGQILKWNGGSWACAADDDTQYAVASGGGIALNGNRFSLVSSCSAGELLKWNGTNWVCAPDDNAGGTVTSVSATGPLTSTGGRTPTIALGGVVPTANGGTGLGQAPSASGQFLKSSGSGAWGIGTLATSDIPNLSALYVDTSSAQTIGGMKTFLNPIAGNLLGNASTVTNGVYTSGSYSDPAWITALAGAKITGSVANADRVTNGVYTTEGYQDPAWINTLAGWKITGTVAHAANADTVTNGVYTSGAYANPAWLTSLAGSKITGSVASAGDFTNGLDGDVTGTQLATQVTGLHGKPIAWDIPLGDGQVLKFNGVNQRWEPAMDNDSGGRVYSVTSQAPIVTTGINTPTLSITQAGTSSDGYLSSTDWNRFNGKVAGVTATAPLTSSGGTAPAIGLAGCSTNQILKWNGSAWACATDQIGTGTVTSVAAGTGLSGGTITTSGTLSIAPGGVTSALLASDAASLAKVSAGTMAVSGTSVGIGTSSPQATLDVRGNVTLEAGGSPSLFTGTGTSELNRYLQLLNSPAAQSGSGLKAAGALVADDYTWANPGKNDLVVKGNLGVGTATPGAKVDVAGDVRVSGRVLTPNKPWFIAGDNRDWLSGQGWTPVVYNTVLKGNAGNWYDPVSGRFTAPVSGLYLCHSAHYVYPNASGATYIHHAMGCNGDTSGGCGMGFQGELSIFGEKPSAEGPYGSSTSITRFVSLNAGEYVQVYVYVSEQAQYSYGKYATFSCALLN